MHQECAKPELRGARGVREVCVWGMEPASCMRNRDSVMNFGCDGEFGGGGEVLLLLSSPAVLIRSGALRRSGRVYLDTAPATRHDGGRVERGERRRASVSVSDDVVVSCS